MRIKNILIISIVVLAGATSWLAYRVHSLQSSVDDFQNQINLLDAGVKKVSSDTSELARRQAVVQKSQDQLLQDSVKKITPAVVSIVISEDVPKLEVQYVNPFGDDPLFQNFNVQVPVYRQVGTEKQNVGAGSGFIVSSDGYIVTNKHVVTDTAATYTVLLANGTQKNATVVWRDPVNDLAVVKITGSSFPTVSLGNSNSLQLGQSVFAVGNALGEYNNSVSVGIISGLNRSIQAQTDNGTETLSGVIQTDAAINPGNSGGPLVDLNGQVVGVNVAMVQGSQSIGFSIPVSVVNSALAKLGI
jgi:serine protease Do